MDELLRFVEQFVERMKRQKKAFSISDIERAFNQQRSQENKKNIKLTNMQRLMLVSRLIKLKTLERTYQMTGYGRPYRVIFSVS